MLPRCTGGIRRHDQTFCPSTGGKQAVPGQDRSGTTRTTLEDTGVTERVVIKLAGPSEANVLDRAYRRCRYTGHTEKAVTN